MKKSVLVTVGTTQFSSLIRLVDSPGFYQAARAKGFTHATIQFGRGDFQPTGDLTGSIKTKITRYSTEMTSLIDEADLVICHAGAGTLLQCLLRGKNVLTVINQSLQDNHQDQLWGEVAKLDNVLGSHLHDLMANFERAGARPGGGAKPRCGGESVLSKVFSELCEG